MNLADINIVLMPLIQAKIMRAFPCTDLKGEYEICSNCVSTGQSPVQEQALPKEWQKII